jgi:hypothetical protein
VQWTRRASFLGAAGLILTRKKSGDEEFYEECRLSVVSLFSSHLRECESALLNGALGGSLFGQIEYSARERGLPT